MRLISKSSSRAVSLFVSAAFASCLSVPALGQNPPTAPAPLITQTVDETQRTVLKGNTHRLAQPQYDLGLAPADLPMERMLLVLKRSPMQEYALRKMLDDQQDKKSPVYHKWLTPEQFGQKFGPTDADMQTITTWLQSHGFQVGTTKGRTLLEFSGTASQVQEAFRTTIHKYLVNGQQHWANANDPSIPTAMVPAVAGIKTLHNFVKTPMVHLTNQRVGARIKPKSRPQFTSSTGLHALVPADYATIYNATSAALNGLDGTGITIAVVARSNLFNDGTGDGSDVTEFREVFGLPVTSTGTAYTPILNGPDPGDLGGDDELEATLDASWSGAIATGAAIDFVISASTNTTDGIDLSELYIIENNTGNVMTESFGTCEAIVTSADAVSTGLLAEQAAAQGISYMVSSGDTGAEGCDNLGETTATGGISVSVLASTGFNTAVGGTLFDEGSGTYWSSTNGADLGSAVSYIPEVVWNETCTSACTGAEIPLAAGGGGASVYVSKPSWQFGVTGIPGDGARDLPDVSLTAAGHDPYLLCLEGSCDPNADNEISFAGVEGTSASAPSFAGMIALVDEQMANTVVGPRQGLANYVLYPLAVAQQTAGTECNASTTPLPNAACVFNDITVGNNSVPGEPGYPNGQYAAGVGFDLASGIGSVNVANLINAWSSATFRATTTTLALTPTTNITHGESVSVDIGVAASSGTGTPAGDVALLAASGGSNGGGSSVALYTLSSGSTSGTTRLLPGGGPYAVTAHYSGNKTSTASGTFAPSDSNPVMITVSPESSGITVSQFTINSNGQTVALSGGSTLPFGSLVFIRADVAGASGQGVPTGDVTFTDNGSCNSVSPCPLPGAIFNPVVNPVSLNSQGNTSIGAGVINFDAGTHQFSATYAGDPSFNSSSTVGPAGFTIQPGFTGISGLGSVNISVPGQSGSTTLGIIASTGFSTSVSVTCSGLPAGAACGSTSIVPIGPNNPVTGTITVTTTAASAMVQPNRRAYYLAMIGVAGLPFGAVLMIIAPKRRRWAAWLAILLFIGLVGLPACGGGGSGSGGGGGGGNPGTPAGTYNVTVTATAGTLSQTEGTFTLTVQ